MTQVSVRTGDCAGLFSRAREAACKADQGKAFDGKVTLIQSSMTRATDSLFYRGEAARSAQVVFAVWKISTNLGLWAAVAS